MLRNRFNIIIGLVCIIGVIFVIQLFNLQIVNGASYREQSSKRLVRESEVYAPRGEIYDRYGKQLVTSETGYSVQIYRTKVTATELNEILLKVATVLEKNNDEYYDSIPIDYETMTFTKTDESMITWKKQNSIREDLDVEGVIDYFKEKYKIENEDINEVRKIIAMRYEIVTNGYTSYKPVTLAKNISVESVMEIEERSGEMLGIHVYTQPIRKYLTGSIASHILGYVGKISSTEYENRKDEGYSLNDIIGKSGIESTFEKFLRGTNGSKRLEMDSQGRITSEEEMEESKMGDSIVLTIDLDLQKATEEALEGIVNKIQTGGFALKFDDAKAGAAIVLNVKTGEVLSMASYPNYNPDEFTDGISNSEYQKYFNSKDKPMFNRAIQGTYSPGSTFKMITGIAALESGTIKASDTIVDEGIFKLYKDYQPVCWVWKSRHTTHGAVNASDALKISCNYYYYEVASRMGIDTISNFAKKFGLGQKTGIELIGETSGTLASKEYVEKANKTWTDGNTLSAAIGQSYNSFTPLQMCYYIATLANRGEKNKVTIIKDVIDSFGESLEKEELSNYINERLGLSSEDLENINLKDETIKAIFEGMKSVTGDSSGTAYGTFSSFPIEVAGKTGTATASNGADNAWFVGFAPYDDPEIAVVAIVEHGGHGYYTAPAVKQIMEEYFGYNNDNIDENMKLNSMEIKLVE